MTILAIDIGSSSTRTEIYDGALNPVDQTFSQRTYQLKAGPDGKAELDPTELLETVRTCVTTSVQHVENVDAIGVSCFWHSLMGVDEQDNPTTAVLMWADTRAAPTVRDLSTNIDLKDHHQRTGTRLHTSYPMAKLPWLLSDDPAHVDRTKRWMSFPEFLQLKLTGTLTISTSMASGTGLFNRTSLEWDEAAMNHAGISADTLSPLSDVPVRVPDSVEWPELAGARLVPAIGDGAANNLGSYAISSSHPALMVGTTGALRLITSNPPDKLPSRLWQYRLDAENALLGGALSEGGGVIAWLMETLRAPDHEELERRISAASPVDHGLIVLPYLAGERSPNWHSDAVGTIHGIRLDTDPTDIIQATMESIGYSFAAILDDLDHLLHQPVEIIATGNALRLNRTWLQMIADICGYPLLLPDRTESSLRGAALHALRQLGAEPPSPDVTAGAERFEPRPEHSETYRDARNRQAELYRLLVER